MTNNLHSDLATLLDFFRKQREKLPSEYAYMPGLLPAPSFFSVKKLQEYVNNPLISPAWIHVISKGKSVPLEEACYFKSVQSNQLQFMNKDLLNNQLKNGAALVLEGVDILDAEINRFTGELENILPCSLSNCVAMFSQYGNEAYEGHCDSDDVLVVQVSGEKLWHIYEPQQRRYADTTHMDKQRLGKEIKQIVLKPGDALYVRAGVPHMCETPNDHSLHLAFDLIDSTPNVAQITSEANGIYDYECEEPFAPASDVMKRYIKLIESDDFQNFLVSATKGVRDDASKFRQCIGRSSTVDALSKYS